MGAEKLIRDGVIRSLSTVIDFDDVIKVCNNKLKDALTVFPASVTQELNEAELMSLLMWKLFKEEPQSYIREELKQTMYYTEREFIQSVCRKFILNESEVDFSFCSFVLACHMWQYRKRDDDVYGNEVEPHMLESWCNGSFSFKKYYFRTFLTPSEVRGGLNELLTYFIDKRGISIDEFRYDFEDLLREYGLNVLAAKKVDWYHPDRKLVGRYLNDLVFSVIEDTIRLRFIAAIPDVKVTTTLDMAIEVLKKYDPKKYDINVPITRDECDSIVRSIKEELNGTISAKQLMPVFISIYLPMKESDKDSIVSSFKRRVILAAYYASCQEFYDTRK